MKKQLMATVLAMTTSVTCFAASKITKESFSCGSDQGGYLKVVIAYDEKNNFLIDQSSAGLSMIVDGKEVVLQPMKVVSGVITPTNFEFPGYVRRLSVFTDKKYEYKFRLSEDFKTARINQIIDEQGNNYLSTIDESMRACTVQRN